MTNVIAGTLSTTTVNNLVCNITQRLLHPHVEVNLRFLFILNVATRGRQVLLISSLYSTLKVAH